MEGSPPHLAGQHDARISAPARRVASPDLASGFLLQERKEGDIPDDDDPQSLRLVVQGQDDPLHGQVSLTILYNDDSPSISSFPRGPLSKIARSGHTGRPVCLKYQLHIAAEKLYLWLDVGSVTRSGDLLDFGHLFKSFGNN